MSTSSIHNNNNENNNLHNIEVYRKLVLDKMESSGLINNIRAKLKSSIVDIISKQNKDVKQKLDFEFLTVFQRQAKKSKELMLLSHLILEFMQFYEMEYTIPIYQKETNIKENVKKDTLIKDCYFTNDNNTNMYSNYGGYNNTSNNIYDKESPILLQILNNYLTEKSNKENNKSNLKNNYSSSLYNAFDKDKEISTSNYGLLSSTNEDNNTKSCLNNEKNNTTSSEKTLKKKLTPINIAESSKSASSLNLEENNKQNNEDDNNPFKQLLRRKQEKNKIENKFNNTNVYDDNEINKEENNNDNTTKEDNYKFKYSNYNNNENNDNDNKYNTYNDNEIKEEIIVDNVPLENNDFTNDKEKSINSLYNHTSSQTFGYDNSVTSYNLDFYDYVEEIQKVDV